LSIITIRCCRKALGTWVHVAVLEVLGWLVMWQRWDTAIVTFKKLTLAPAFPRASSRSQRQVWVLGDVVIGVLRFSAVTFTKLSIAPTFPHVSSGSQWWVWAPR
jgi:hypothetical protein